MLVLGIPTGESIQIGNHIRVTLIRRQGNGARIGISAPRRIPILRDALQARGNRWRGWISVWKLISYALPPSIRRSVFEPAFGDFLEQYLNARREFRGGFAGFCLQLIWTVRTCTLLMECGWYACKSMKVVTCAGIGWGMLKVFTKRELPGE